MARFRVRAWAAAWTLAAIFGSAGVLVCAPSGARAQDLGGISVSPKRVVFEGRTRTAEVMLLNRAGEAATYRISFENQRMKADGTPETITAPDPGQLFADAMLVYSPRQVVVPAGGSQTVRVLLRLPAQLADGEYRSHMVFKSVPPPSAGQTIDPNLKPGEVSVSLIPTYVITIPVIVRHGTLAAAAGLLDPKVAKAGTATALSVTLTRSGTRSTYGDILVTAAGAKEPVALIRGVSVYTPNTSRTVNVPFAPGKAPASGTKLHIVYQEGSAEAPEVLAASDWTVP